MIPIVTWLLLSVLSGVIGWKTRCKRIILQNQMSSGVAMHLLNWPFHAMRDLWRSPGFENQRGEEAWYLAQQIEEAMVHISVCITVTFCLRSYVEDIRRPISLGWKKSGLLWLVLIRMMVGSYMLSAFESRWFGLDVFVDSFLSKPCKIDPVGLFSCWTYLCIVWQWQMHTCSRSKLNEAVECDDQGREDISYLAQQIEEAMMYVSMCIVVTFCLRSYVEDIWALI